jgi:Ca2+-binding EF-hand superfamily protein
MFDKNGDGRISLEELSECKVLMNDDSPNTETDLK